MLLGKLVAGPADAPPPPESAPEQEVSADDAAREVALAFPAVADLARTGKLSPEVIEELRAAARAFLADDLAPRPPVDVEAERVDPGAVAQQSEPPDEARPVQPSPAPLPN